MRRAEERALVEIAPGRCVPSLGAVRRSGVPVPGIDARGVQMVFTSGEKVILESASGVYVRRIHRSGYHRRALRPAHTSIRISPVCLTVDVFIDPDIIGVHFVRRIHRSGYHRRAFRPT
jgi:hypothetical protein